jgi:hypothetical protein
VVQHKLLRADSLCELARHLGDGVPTRKRRSDHSLGRTSVLRVDLGRDVRVGGFVDEERWGRRDAQRDEA